MLLLALAEDPLVPGFADGLEVCLILSEGSTILKLQTYFWLAL